MSKANRGGEDPCETMQTRIWLTRTERRAEIELARASLSGTQRGAVERIAGSARDALPDFYVPKEDRAACHGKIRPDYALDLDRAGSKRKGKTMRHLLHTFGDLPIGATFWFDAKRTTVRGATYKQRQDPWVKVDTHKYRDLDDADPRAYYHQSNLNARVRTTPPDSNRARVSTKPVDFGNGIRVVYLPVNQAWVVMWNDQIVRGPISRHEAMTEAAQITSASPSEASPPRIVGRLAHATYRTSGNRAKGGARIENVEVHVIEDDQPDTSYMDQDDENWQERKEAFQRGAFSFVGVQAVATILIPTGAGMGFTQRIQSPGLWGIETDSRRSYFREVAKEEIAQLKDALETLGANTRGFASLARDAIESVYVGEPDPPKRSRKKS